MQALRQKAEHSLDVMNLVIPQPLTWSITFKECSALCRILACWEVCVYGLGSNWYSYGIKGLLYSNSLQVWIFHHSLEILCGASSGIIKSNHLMNGLIFGWSYMHVEKSRFIKWRYNLQTSQILSIFLQFGDFSWEALRSLSPYHLTDASKLQNSIDIAVKGKDYFVIIFTIFDLPISWRLICSLVFNTFISRRLC